MGLMSRALASAHTSNTGSLLKRAAELRDRPPQSPPVSTDSRPPVVRDHAEPAATDAELPERAGAEKKKRSTRRSTRRRSTLSALSAQSFTSSRRCRRV